MPFYRLVICQLQEIHNKFCTEDILLLAWFEKVLMFAAYSFDNLNNVFHFRTEISVLKTHILVEYVTTFVFIHIYVNCLIAETK